MNLSGNSFLIVLRCGHVIHPPQALRVRDVKGRL